MTDLSHPDQIHPDASRCGVTPERLARRLKVIDHHRAPGGLVIHEIYASIQGESTYAGRPCTFVRTSGCHLRCGYCDTPHAFAQGEWRSHDDILREVEGHGLPLVELTGGEPLLQPEVLPLMKRLCDAGYTVLLETSGSLGIDDVDPRVVRIVDFKTPSSKELGANRYEIIPSLRPSDEVKLVLGSREDYLWAKNLVFEHELARRCTVLMGTVFGALAPRELVDWVVADRLPVRVQLQMHKVIWDPDARGV